MKKYTLLLSSLLTVASLSAISGQVFAADATADTSIKGTSDVTAELTGGSLELTSVPKALNFGKENITDQAFTMGQVGTGTVSVSDLRGTGAGYTVNVALTTQFTSTSTSTSDTHKLDGPTLKLVNAGGAAKQNNSNTTTGITVKVGTNNAAIIKADTGQGMGIWDYSISGSKLGVPSGAYAGAYTGTLTWTLTSGITA